MSGLVLRGGLVLDPGRGRAEPQDLLLRDGQIAAVLAPGADAGGAETFDARDRLVLPGLVNAHTHGHANLMKGVADRWTLEASLTNGPWLGGARDPETIYLSTLIGAVDMLSKGCTACYDLVYEFPLPTREGFLAVARAYADAGMKAVLAPMIADQTLFQSIPGIADSLPEALRQRVGRFGLDGEATLDAVEAIAADQASLPPGIKLAIAPTIPHHCSEKFLMRCIAIAERYGLPMHMHIAESRLQAVAARQLWGKSPVEYLAERGVLRPGFTAAHAVWLDEGDWDLLAQLGCGVAHIPASNFRLGSGVAAVRPLLDRGIPVGLATDGANSSDALSMLQAMRLASYGARAFAGPREDWLSAAETLRLATTGGSKILGLDGGGRIAEGAPADLVLFDLGHVDFLPLTDAVNQIVTCADSASITDVFSAGRPVVRDGAITTVDLTDLRRRVGEAVARLAASLGEARALAAQLEPHVVAFARLMAREPLGFERFLPAFEGQRA